MHHDVMCSFACTMHVTMPLQPVPSCTTTKQCVCCRRMALQFQGSSSGLTVVLLALDVFRAGTARRSQPPLASPDALMGIYLLNPFTILSSTAGTTTSLENLCIVAAVYAACMGDLVAAAFAIACGAYIGLHPLLLLVRLVETMHDTCNAT
jgi:hypothetical protein